jgi:S-adenosylmethionine hydrolase
MARPIIALLTDFGSRDHYAGVMKGVILGICPDVTLVDISHDLPPHDIVFAAHELAATAKYFPPGTIFLVVVDPGVGTTRRGLAVEAGDRRFVAPDNGVLTAIIQETPPKRVVELMERRYARPTVSRTFEGRDRFAPRRGVDRQRYRSQCVREACRRFQRARIAATDRRRRNPSRRRHPSRSVRQRRHEHRSPLVRASRERSDAAPIDRARPGHSTHRVDVR